MADGDPASTEPLSLQYHIASIFARSCSAKEALARSLERLANEQGWECGIAWKVRGEQFHPAARYMMPGAGARARALFDSAQDAHRAIDPALLEALTVSTQVCRCKRKNGCCAVCAWRKWAADAGYRYAVALPLSCGGALYGLIELFRAEPAPAQPNVIPVLQTLAADMGQFLHARRFESRLQSRNARLVEVQRIARLAYWECSPGTWRLRSTGNAWEVLGLAQHQLPTTLYEYLELVPEEEREHFSQALPRISDPAIGHAEFEHHVSGNGHESERVIIIRALGEFDARGKLLRISGTMQDITAYRQLQRRLQLAATAIEHAGDAIVIFDARGGILSTNPAFQRITGYAEDEVRGQQLDALLNRPSGRHDESFYRRIIGRLRTFGRWKGELWGRRKDGRDFAMLLSLTEVRDAVGRVSHHVGVFTDISRQREYKEHLEQLALHDSLTGLPNRALFQDRCRQAISLSSRTGIPVGIVFIDLDLFKQVNDDHGHAIGDEILRQAAGRMRFITRDCDTVARLGGDEFVVLLTEVANEASCVAAVERLIDGLTSPYRVNGITIEVGASMGVAMSPVHGHDIDTLLHRADQALYSVKRDAARRYAVWAPELEKLGGVPRITFESPPSDPSDR